MIYLITVKPGSKKGPLVVASGNELVVYLREKPIEGQANTALIKQLAAHFHVPKGSIRIKSGAHSRKKMVEILDL